MERDQASKFVNDLLRLMVSRNGSGRNSAVASAMSSNARRSLAA